MVGWLECGWRVWAWDVGVLGAMLRESEAAGRDDVGEQNAERWPWAWTCTWRVFEGGEDGVGSNVKEEGLGREG